MINKTLINRSLSVATCVILFFVVWYSQDSFVYALKMSPAFLFPLSLIWFGDFFGSRLGFAGFGGSYTYIDKPSPGWMVATVGWVFLIGIPVLAWLT